MAHLVEILRKRGFIEQTTHEQETHDYFEQSRPTGYIDLIPPPLACISAAWCPFMSLAHMQREGHRRSPRRGGTAWWATPAAKPDAHCSPLRKSSAMRPGSSSSFRVFNFRRGPGAAAQQRRVADENWNTSLF